MLFFWHKLDSTVEKTRPRVTTEQHTWKSFRGETSVGVAKCRLFSQAIASLGGSDFRYLIALYLKRMRVLGSEQPRPQGFSLKKMAVAGKGPIRPIGLVSVS